MTLLNTICLNKYYLYYNTNECKYLLNDNKELLLGQLIDYTIHHVCEHLGIPTINELGIILPNKYLISLIKEFNIELPEDCDICKKLGIYYYPKTKNKFVYNNIGGQNKTILELDISQNYLNLNIEPHFISNENIIPIVLPIDNRFSYETLVNAKNKPEKKAFLKGLIDKLQKERSIIGIENIQKGTTIIQKLGKIDYSIHSSYIDTIIMLFNIPFQNIFFENIFNIQQRINKLNKPTYLSLYFKKLTRSVVTKKLLNLNNVFNEYSEKILNGEILNVQKLRISFQTNFNEPDILKHPYYLSKNNFPIFNFYKDFLKLNLIDNYPYSSLHKFFINPQQSDILPIKLENLSIIADKIEDIAENSEHIGFEIKGDILKYFITRDRYKQISESRIYCPICNEFINRFDKKHMNFHQSNKILLSEAMNLKIDIIHNEYISKPNISILDNSYFYDDKPDELYSLQEALTRDMVTQYERAVYEYSIYNTQSISFFINRLEKRINKQSNMEETNFIQTIPVQIEETLTDKNSNKYILTAIITESLTNHLLFFKYDNIWYIFNSMFDPELQTDYIQKIGTIQQLIDYRDGIIQTTGVIYFYIRE